MSQPAINTVIGPTTTGMVTNAGTKDPYFGGLILSSTGVNLVVARAGGASGPLLGAVQTTAAGAVASYVSQPLVKAVGGIHLTISGAGTPEIGVLVA